jgi:Concanavalin A-like lectin/glucanases superfamily
MSYYRTVLADFPVSYYTLDEVKSGSIDYYSQILASYSTYQAVKDAFALYSDISGQPVLDFSGNNNNGTVSGISGSKIMPLVSGGIYGTLISDQTVITYVTPGLANKYYSDNPFTIEVWAKMPNTSSSLIPIVADLNSTTGLYYENGDIVFKVSSNSLRYKISNNKALHIVASYNKNSLTLYINGSRVASQQINSFVFSNDSTTFVSGPSLSNNYFVIDSVAFYRYGLSASKILLHYTEGINELNYSQIVYPDGGYLFSLNHSKIRPVARYYYPGTKQWSELVNENVIMPTDQSYITFLQTTTSASKTFTFTETIIVPSALEVTSSQIAWEDDVDNISVQVSRDGTTWQNCKNNSPIPYFNKNDGITNGLLYLKVTMTSSDTSTDIPILRSLSLDLFSNTDFYADNSGDRIYSVKDYALSRYNHPIISYNDYNGLRMYNGSGFDVDSPTSFRSIEMIFTPVSGENVLFSSNSKIFEWNSAGLINKTGVSAIYVNGVDFTSSTNISSFLTTGMPHHIVLVLSSVATSNIRFNYNQTNTKSGGANTYSNIALYPDVLSSQQATTHYQLYTHQYVVSVSDTAFTVSESSTGNDATAYLINNTEYQSSNI